MPDDNQSDVLRLDDLRNRQCIAWERGERLLVETLIAGLGRPLMDSELLELIYAEVTLRAERGGVCVADEYVQRFPQFAESIERLFAIHEALEAPAVESSAAVEPPQVHRPQPRNVSRSSDRNPPFGIQDAPDKTGVYQPGDTESFAVDSATSQPKHIGRYRVEKVLGQGGFGLVYLAHDDQLQRLVAIKVPHPHLVAQTTQAEACLIEARAVANLDHPHIVPVHDVGSTDQFPCFVVSKYIDGTDLATRLRQSRLTLQETVELVATVAEALHHAHKRGLVHRDIKPGNLLLDMQGNPFVAQRWEFVRGLQRGS